MSKPTTTQLYALIVALTEQVALLTKQCAEHDEVIRALVDKSLAPAVQPSPATAQLVLSDVKVDAVIKTSSIGRHYVQAKVDAAVTNAHCSEIGKSLAVKHAMRVYVKRGNDTFEFAAP